MIEKATAQVRMRRSPWYIFSHLSRKKSQKTVVDARKCGRIGHTKSVWTTSGQPSGFVGKSRELDTRKASNSKRPWRPYDPTLESSSV